MTMSHAECDPIRNEDVTLTTKKMTPTEPPNSGPRARLIITGKQSQENEQPIENGVGLAH